MKVELVGYPKCSTCKKAHASLVAAGNEVNYRDIVRNPLTVDELKEWVELSGLPLNKWFNSSGNKYKELGLKITLPTLSDEEKIALLATDGMLVKRPVIRLDNQVTLGFKS